MPRLPVLRAAAVSGLLAAATAAQQDVPENFPRAYLVTAEKVAAKTTAYGDQEKALALRPNTDTAYHLFVENPGQNKTLGAVTVVLSQTEDGSRPVAKGTLPPGLDARASARVPLTLVAPPVAVPAKPADPAAPPAGPAVSLAAGKLYLLTGLEVEDKRVQFAKPVALDFGVNPPANYIEPARQSTFKQAADGSWEIALTLFGGRKNADGTLVRFDGPPAKARLDVRAALSPNLDESVPKAGTYETEVPPGSAGVELRATGLRFNGDPQGRFAVSIDGYDRALVYDIGPQGNNGTPSGAAFALLALPKFHVTGKPLPLRAEVFQEVRDAKPVLDFQRSAAGEAQHLLAGATNTRQVATAVRGGEAGELVFKAAVSDLTVTLDTAGVYGERAFTLTTDQPGFPAFTRTVTFDATPPTVLPEPLPATKLIGSTLQVFATVTDAESGVSEVLFFLGDPPGPDGKLPPTSEGVKAALATVPKGGRPTPGRYTAFFTLPETRGKVKVGVRAVNGAGLVTTTEPVNLRVVDPAMEKERAKRAVGDIKVRVIQGSTPERPQPGLTVELRTAGGTGPTAGGIVKVATTDAKGEATFKDIAPGAYIVYTVKLADLGAKGVAPISVEADKQTNVTLEVKR